VIAVDSITSSLLDFGALGLFAGFLIWLNTRMQKRLDETVEQFRKTLEMQETAHAAAEELIRSRYDNLLAQYNAERGKLYDDVVKKLDQIALNTSTR
jgi:predicted ABC-type ATPase